MSNRSVLVALLLLLNLPFTYSNNGLSLDKKGVQSAPERPNRAHEGTVVGTVSDDGGNVVSGATVLLQDSVTQENPVTVKTNDKGQYKFTSLLPGDYEVWATRGDQESEHLPLKVANGASSVNNLTLKKAGAPK